MKKYILVSILILSLASCEIETLSNGVFDGYWHMEKCVNAADGSSQDVSGERIYWAVEGKLLQVLSLGNKEGDRRDIRGYYLRFTNTGKELVLFEPYKNGWHEDAGPEGGDTPIEDITPLERYGIYNIPEHFTIEKLDNGNMVLVSEKVTLSFTKQ